MQVPTVRVASDVSPGGFMLINASDFVDGVHELWTEDDDGGRSSVSAAPAALDGELLPPAQTDAGVVTVRRGPRGRWYGWRGKDCITAGFMTEAEAQVALDAVGG